MLIGIRCDRCRVKVWIDRTELREAPPGPIHCECCRDELRAHPERAAREYAEAERQARRQSDLMRERWANADAKKAKR